jgi:hypothetical protein
MYFFQRPLEAMDADKFVRNEFEQLRWPRGVNFMDEIHKSSPMDGLWRVAEKMYAAIASSKLRFCLYGRMLIPSAISLALSAAISIMPL